MLKQRKLQQEELSRVPQQVWKDGDFPKGAILRIECPGCHTWFLRETWKQTFCTPECGTAYYKKREDARNRGVILPSMKTINQGMGRELVAVKKAITSDQAEAYITPAQPELIGMVLGNTCAGCGGPVLQQSQYGFDYCGGCT